MPRRVARLFLRLAGWVLTPLVLITAAAIGATLGLFIAPEFSSATNGLVLTGALALAAAIVGLILWVRLLRQHPQLRHTLEMTVQGTPDSPVVQRLIHPDDVKPDGVA
jgi:hypothetical protein